MTDETQEQVSEGKSNTQEYDTYFRISEEISPTQKKCLIEMDRPVNFYDKNNKEINFSSSRIEIIANTSALTKGTGYKSGSLSIVAKFDDEAGQKSAPDFSIRKNSNAYPSICDLQLDYKNLGEKILKAYANRKKVKLRDWRETKTPS